MKKIIAMLITLALVMSLVVGCGKKEEQTTSTPTQAPATEEKKDETAETPAETPADTTAAAAKTGLGVITAVSKSKNASAEGDGLAQIDSTIVAVLVGADGKILDVKIDAAQTKINFSTEGKLTTDVATIFKTKQELGDEYGMRKASSIGKEWFEQANALADYVVGKTIDEVKGIALNEKAAPADADLAASVTVSISGYVAALEKAVATAQELGATEGDKIGLGVTTEISKSKDAAADADGLGQAYTNISVVTVNAEGKITSAITDAVQGNVNFNAKGEVTTDLASSPATKLELKEDYGMKKASAIGKEWYEQANAFSAYITGKTLAEVKGIALDETGAATDADLAASVSVHVGPFIANVEKAVAAAK